MARRTKKYNPLDDPVVKASLKARTQRSRNKAEKSAIVNTDNGPAVTDLEAISEFFGPKKKRGRK